MSAIISDKFRIYNAEQFLSALGDEFYDSENTLQNPGGVAYDERDRLYFFVGRPQKWYAVLEVYSKVDAAGGWGAVVTGDQITTSSGFGATIREVYEDAITLELITGPNNTESSPLKGEEITVAGGAGIGSTAVVGLYRYSTEDVAPTAFDNDKEVFSVYDDLIAAKRMTIAYTRGVVRRYNWDLTPGTRTYDMYRNDFSATGIAGGGGLLGRPGTTHSLASPQGATSLGASRFYVMNQNYEVWKCLYNGAHPDNAEGPYTGIPAQREPSKSAAGGGAGQYRDPGSGGDGLYIEDLQNLGNSVSAPVIYAPAQGYVWKFMFRLPIDDVLRFLSTDFMPIPLRSVNNANGSFRNEVEDLTDSSYAGAIQSILIKNKDTLLGDGTYYAPILGDGTGGLVSFTVSTGVVGNVSIVSQGTDYTYANVEFATGDATGSNGNPYGIFDDQALTTGSTVAAGETAALEPIISPRGGHGGSRAAGADGIEREFNTKRVMANIRLSYAEGSGDFPVDNDFRRIGILRNPDSVANQPAIEETLTNVKKVRVTDASLTDYVFDEQITQVLADGGIAKGRVISWTKYNTTQGLITYYQNVQEHTDKGVVFAFGDAASGAGPIVGAESNTSADVDTVNGNPSEDPAGTYVDGIADSEFIANTGDVIYLENRRLITRAPDQIEDIKLVIEF